MGRKDWLYGRNVVLTGCSTGMGKEVLLILVKKYGCNVMGVARNKAKLDELKAELGDKFSYRRFNISSQEEWYKFAEELKAMNFGVDIVINNAGMIQPFTQYTDLPDDQAMKVINTNLLSIVYSCKAMIPLVKESQFGFICNVASASAILPFGGQAIYSATKGGVNGLTQSLVQELRGYGIGVCSIMPGPVKTDIYKAREGEADGQQKADKLVEGQGITAATAGKRIVNAIAKRKIRVVLDGMAKMMDLGMRVCPRITVKLVAKAMKGASSFVNSFKPIFAEQIEKKDEIKAKIKGRKAVIKHDISQVAPGPFANDDLTNV